ncbi:MAG: DUF2155 domain-containing protein [Holosporaceae bacterium]|jgi:hypothetical protein|nr:DUF2155 domain-containing protein [Holosporaceae bacterium]
MRKKTEFWSVVAAICLLLIAEPGVCEKNSGPQIKRASAPRRSLGDLLQEEDFEEKSSIWESKLLEIYGAKVQILDKISGKVFQQRLSVNKPISFGSVQLTLRRCFQNGPEDNKEIYAFIEIVENGRKIFSKWLYASSPSVNQFVHPVYDVRVEF